MRVILLAIVIVSGCGGEASGEASPSEPGWAVAPAYYLVGHGVKNDANQHPRLCRSNMAERLRLSGLASRSF